MPHPTRPTCPTRPKSVTLKEVTTRLIRWFLAAAAIGALAVTGWWFWPLPPEAPLRSDWPATVRVIAGSGHAVLRDGSAFRAGFTDPFGVAVAADGAVLVADGAFSHRIRRIATDGSVSTLAGGAAGMADGSGPAAQFNTPSGIALDAAGTLLVADTANNRIRRVTPEGVVTTVAGQSDAGLHDGPTGEALFNGPLGVAVDAAGRIVVADTYNDRIRVVADGHVTTLTGDAPGFVDGTLADARFDTPSGIAVTSSGTIYVADTGNDALREISNGVDRTLQIPLSDPLRAPIGITIDRRGVLYVTDERGRVIEVTSAAARVVAGSQPGFRDGPGEDAFFRRPSGIVSPEPGRLVVADTGNALVRLIAAPGGDRTAPPGSPLVAPQFERETFSWQPMLWPLEPLEGPFEIAGTLGEARGAGAERFHSGIDVRADQGTRVVALREAVVETPIATGAFGTLNEWVRLGPVTYVHLRVGRSAEGDVFDRSRFVATYDDGGQVTRMRVKRGARFLTGERVGTVNAFNHVHVNVGWPGEEYNPLLFRLVQFEDTVPPTIAPGGIRLYDAAGQQLSRRVKGRYVISGPVQVDVEAWDQVDGNRPSRRLGLYSLGYQVLQPNGTPVQGFEQPIETLRFDKLATDPEAPRLVYAPGSGIPFYGERRTRFLYIVTNRLRDGIATPGIWDTAPLPPGDYTLRVHAADIHGNVARLRRDLPVTIVTAE
jgi:sugar lactone lactonase YvrE